MRPQNSKPARDSRRAVGVARPPAAALGEEHHRQPPALGELDHPVHLLVVVGALGAGQHGVVVGHHRAAGGLVGRTASPLTRPRPMTRPSAGVVLDQLLERAAPPARGDGQRAVFDEGAGIDQVVDVLPRRALAGLAPARDRVRPRRVERLARGARCTSPGRGGCGRDRPPRPRSAPASPMSASSMNSSGWSSNTVSPAGDGELADVAGDVGGDHVLHLHRFHDRHRLAGAHGRRRPRRARLTIVPCSGARSGRVPRGRARPRTRAVGGRSPPLPAPRAPCRGPAPPADRRRRPWRRPGAAPRLGAKCRRGWSAWAASSEFGRCAPRRSGCARRSRRRPAAGPAPAGTECCSQTPVRRNSPSARSAFAAAHGQAGARGRSPWPAGSRSGRWCGSRRSRSRRRGCPVRTAARRRRARRPTGCAWPSAVMVSRLTRACIATPRGAGTARLVAEAELGQVAPPAIASCRRTRSRPVTSSVTVCSTCRRGLASMKAKAGSPPAAVDQEFEGAEARCSRRASAIFTAAA